MIPLKDNIPSNRPPIVNYAIIAACSVAFLVQIGGGGDAMVWKYGMIPARLLHPGEPVVIRKVVLHHTIYGVERHVLEQEAPEPAISPWWTLLTCMFLHGGWLHIIGNMWFLY